MGNSDLIFIHFLSRHQYNIYSDRMVNTSPGKPTILVETRIYEKNCISRGDTEFSLSQRSEAIKWCAIFSEISENRI